MKNLPKISNGVKKQKFTPTPKFGVTSRSKGGFTLIELLVVIAVIGLLATIVSVSVNSARKKARDTKRLADANQIKLAMEMYYDNNNSYPSSGGNWRCLGHTSSQTCWIGAYSGLDSLNTALIPYLPTIPDDPRNNTSCYGDAYLYYNPYPAPGFGNRGPGAYLHWYYESSDTSDKACGQGFYGGANGCGNYCWLYIGPN